MDCSEILSPGRESPKSVATVFDGTDRAFVVPQHLIEESGREVQASAATGIVKENVQLASSQYRAPYTSIQGAYFDKESFLDFTSKHI